MFLISPDSGGETDAAILVIIFSRPSTAFVLEYMHNDLHRTETQHNEGGHYITSKHLKGRSGLPVCL